MRNLTEKQQRYLDARIDGAKKIDAARLAGYSGSNSTLSTAASKLEAHPAIKKGLAAAKKAGKSAAVAQGDDEKLSILKPHYKDSAEFMRDCMNNPKLPPNLRFEAAKQLMPYEHAKVGEKGKKENAKDRAVESSSGRFRPKSPPKLHAVK